MAEIANKLLGLKISGQEVWVFSILVYAYADPWFELSAVSKFSIGVWLDCFSDSRSMLN